MYHGDTIPVFPRVVQFGQIGELHQEYLNGDIVLMPGGMVILTEADIDAMLDNSDIWPDPDYPLTQDDLDYEAHCLKQASILKTRERRRCYTCGESGIGRMRRVTGHFVTSKHFDPTEAYRLDCGHSTIDC